VHRPSFKESPDISSFTCIHSIPCTFWVPVDILKNYHSNIRVLKVNGNYYYIADESTIVLCVHDLYCVSDFRNPQTFAYLNHTLRSTINTLSIKVGGGTKTPLCTDYEEEKEDGTT
jgi:hypothetical protein